MAENIELDPASEDARQAMRIARALLTTRAGFHEEGGKELWTSTLGWAVREVLEGPLTLTPEGVDDFMKGAQRRLAYIVAALAFLAGTAAALAARERSAHGDEDEVREELPGVLQELMLIFEQDRKGWM